MPHPPTRALAATGLVLLLACREAVSEGWERPRIEPLAQHVPPALANSPDYRIDPEVRCDGGDRIFKVRSPQGDLDVRGLDLLRIRLHELRVAAALRRTTTGSDFGHGAAEATRSKLGVLGRVFTDFPGTMRALGDGIAQTGRRIGESARGGKSASEDSAWQGLAGASSAKRRLAAELGIDPYTDNPILRRQLDADSWSQAAGSITVGVGSGLVAPAPVDPFLTGLSVSESLQRAVVEKSPADLRADNRLKLAALGLDRDLVEAFLRHRWYSPTRETAITEALVSLGPGKGAEIFLGRALSARDDFGALHFQRLAQMFARYHAERRPILALRHDRNLLFAVDRDGRVFLPVYLDYPLWTERTAKLAANAVRLHQDMSSSRGVEIWFPARIAPSTKDRLTQTGITVRDAILSADSRQNRPINRR